MKRRIFPLGILLLLASAALVCFAEAAAGGEPQRRRASRPRARRPPARRVDYSNFSHRTPQHRQRSCDSCHQSPTPNWASVRPRGAAFPDVTEYPGHASCVDCHRRQFFSGARPVICTVCHTAVSPRADARHPFQNPSERFAESRSKRQEPSDFVVNFPHDRHQDVMARLTPEGGRASVGFLRVGFAPQEEAKKAVNSCNVCHQTFRPQGNSPDEYLVAPPQEPAKNDLNVPAFWMKKGMLKTTPSSHASCFNCHWQDGGERPFSSNCAGCHTLAPGGAVPAPRITDADPAHPSVQALGDAEMLEHWKGRRVARFKHEQGTHESVSCMACHVGITSSGRLGPDTLDVPFLTCASTRCHGAPKSPYNIILRELEQRRKPDGANFQCTKCHLNYGREPTPKSHSDLFPVK